VLALVDRCDPRIVAQFASELDLAQTPLAGVRRPCTTISHGVNSRSLLQFAQVDAEGFTRPEAGS
jgi:hypothetical protein